jgi:hypothetical protein
LNEGKVVGGKPVVARRNLTTLLDLILERLDTVAGSIEIQVKADRIVAIAFRRDVGPLAFLHGKLSDSDHAKVLRIARPRRCH